MQNAKVAMQAFDLVLGLIDFEKREHHIDILSTHAFHSLFCKPSASHEPLGNVSKLRC